VTEIRFGSDTKALYPAVGLKSIDEETIVFIADLNASELWQGKNTLQQPVDAQSETDTQLPPDTSVMQKIFLFLSFRMFCLILYLLDIY